MTKAPRGRYSQELRQQAHPLDRLENYGYEAACLYFHLHRLK